MTNQTNRSDETQDAELDGKLDGALRKIARETHPRQAFVAQLRGELENQAAHPRRDFWSLLRGARPWLAQAVLIVALAALVLIGGTMTSQLFAPDRGEFREIGANLTPSADQNASLPARALARLGKGKIQSIDAAPDGRIAVGSTAGLCVYNTGLTPDWCRWTDSPVHAALFDPSGTRLAVRYGGKPGVEIWDAAQGQVIASREFAISTWYTSPTLPNPNFIKVNGLAWEPAGNQIAVIETGQGVSDWDWQNDAIAWGPVAVGGEPIGVEWLTGPEGESIVAALTPESLTLVDGNTGQAMSTLSGMAGAAPGSFLTLARASQGSRIAVGSDDKISVFDLAAWNVNLYQSIPHPAGRFQGIELSADGEYIAALTNDAQIITFDLRTGQEMARLPAMALTPLEWNPSDGRLYYASPDGSLASFDGRLEGAIIVSGHTLAPQFAAWREDGTVVTLAGRYLYRWDPSTQSLASFSEMTLVDTVMPVGLSRDGSRALFFDPSNNTIIVWDVAQNQPLHELRSSGVLYGVTLSPDGTRIAAVNEDGQIFTWKLLDNGSEERDLSGIGGFLGVEGLAFHPRGEQIAVAYTKIDGSEALEVFDIATQQKNVNVPLGDDPSSREWITGLEWSEDEQFLGAVQGNQTVIWQTSTWERYTPVSQADPQDLRAFAFNRVRGLAAAGRDVLYYAIDGSSQSIFRGHAMNVTDLDFRPDGEALASASNDGTVILWDLGSASLPTVEIQPTATAFNLQEYTVVAGDTCGGIAYTFGISVESLINLNNLSADCSNLTVGQVLRIPYPTPTPDLPSPTDYPVPPTFEPTATVQEYTVVEGDTCGGIAFAFNVSVESLIAANNLAADCSNLTVGQVLIIPYPTPTPLPTNTLESYPLPGQGTPSPTPTRTTMPSQPTPLPDATQHTMPDTTGYDVTQTDGISPSGKWRWIAIRGEWTPGAPREEDLNVIIAASTNGAQTWVLEEWTPHGLGEGRPTGFTFSTDDRYLFFYDSGTPDGCGQPWQGNLRRLNLQNGIIDQIEPFDPNYYGQFSLSPDGARAATVQSTVVEIIDTVSNQPNRQIHFTFTETDEWSVSDIHWMPLPRTKLAFEVVSPPVSLCEPPSPNQRRWTIVAALDGGIAWEFPSPPGTVLSSWRSDAGWGPDGRLIYLAENGSEVIVDPRSGEIAP